ncbi:MAG: ABC transporter permease [Candidatus Omnitrophica bacterium]|nr:ABC transporter permease [Candidatus Omnitrophota bacterium]
MFKEIFLAWRYLFRGRAKHLSFIGIISCLGVILGVATVIIAFSIVNGIDGGLMERIMRFREHVIIESWDDAPLDKVKEEVDTWPEAEFATLNAQTQVFAKFNDSIMPLLVKGIDFSDLEGKDFLANYVLDEFDDKGFFIGEPLEQRYRRNNKTLQYYPLQKKITLKEEAIRGVFSVGLYDIDNYMIIGDLDLVRSLSPNYHYYLGLRLKEPYQANQIKEKVLRKFPEGYLVSSWIDTNEALFATLKLEKIALFIVLALIVLIASFNIFATLTVKVVEKTKDIGILKSLGFSSRKIVSIFTLQGLILGSIGVTGGTLLGLGLCYYLQKYPFIKLPQEIFFSEYLPVVVDYTDVFWIVIVTVLIAFSSSLIPAYRAGKMVACEALRYE